MNKNEAKKLVNEWVEYGLDLSGLHIPKQSISFFVLQFIDFLYKNRYKVTAYQENIGENNERI